MTDKRAFFCVQPRRSHTQQYAAGLLACALLAVLSGCPRAVVLLDPADLRTATDLKTQSLLLMQQAKNPPAAHLGEIQDLKARLLQARNTAVAKGPTNAPVTQEWDLMISPTGGLLGEFLQKWQTENKAQSPVFIAEESKLVSDGFDEILKLENSKPRK